MMEIENTPRYLSSFDLEQARFGQALQKAKLNSAEFSLAPELISKILREVRQQSMNVEFVIKKLAENSVKEEKIALMDFLEKYLLAKS